MRRLLLFLAIVVAPTTAVAQSDQPPGGLLERILSPTGHESAEELPDRPPMVVVLDSGHGGDDVGARSPGQGLEKNVTLRLAGLIKDELEKQKEFRVVMTRDDDRSLTPVERLETANAQGALVFLSLHTAGGDRPVERPLRLFVNDPLTPSNLRAAGEWRYLANRFDRNNRRFADDVAGALKKFYGGNGEIETLATSRLYLGGANLPTVMGEVIDLAGTSGAALADDDEKMAALAGYLAAAIRTAAEREALRDR